MLNDIITAYSGNSPVWESASAKNDKTADGSFQTKLNKAKRMDTVELSKNAPAPASNTFATIKAEKTNIASELSNIHADVNKFLQIKDQVRTGNYELNAADIAKGISTYSIY